MIISPVSFMVCKTKVFVSRTFSTRHLFPAVYCFRLNLSMRNKTGTTRFLGKWSLLSLRVLPADQKAWGFWVRGFPESTRCRVEVCQPYTAIKKDNAVYASSTTALLNTEAPFEKISTSQSCRNCLLVVSIPTYRPLLGGFMWHTSDASRSNEPSHRAQTGLFVTLKLSPAIQVKKAPLFLFFWVNLVN